MVLLGSQWRWDDDSWRDPALRDFINTGSKANVVVRTAGNTTNPREAFAALGTGTRSGEAPNGWHLGSALRSDSTKVSGINRFGSRLSALLNVEVDAAGRESASGLSYPDNYFQNADPSVFTDLLGRALQPGSVTFVDMTVVPRSQQVPMLAAILEQGRTLGWNTMAVSVADADNADRGVPRLQAFLGSGSYFGTGSATTASTHRRGMINLPDVTATILDYFELEIPTQVKGQPVYSRRDLGIDGLASVARRAAIIRPAQNIFIPILSAFVAVVLIGGVWSLNRRTHPNLGDTWERPRSLLTFWRGAGTFVALVPPTAFWMNLVPWWNLGPAATDVAAGEFAWFGAVLPFLLAGVATLIWEGLGLASLLGPLVIISASSLIIGLLDSWIGSPMMLDSVMGTQSTIGGRFYGIDNMMFAIYITGALLVSALIYSLASEKTATPLFIVLVLFAIGVMAIDALPGLGADFGGLLASFPAFAVLFRKFRSQPLKPLLSGVILLFTFGLAGLLTYIDWLRPPARRTHLGNFIDSVREGKLGTVLWEKATQLGSAGWNPWVVGGVTLAFCFGIFLIVWPLLANWRNPYRRDYAWLLGSAAAKTNPDGVRLTLSEKAFLWAWATAMILGTLLNDSTILIGLTGFCVAAPAALAQGAHKYLTASISVAELRAIPSPREM